MTLQDAMNRLVLDRREGEAVRVLVEGVHRISASVAHGLSLDGATGEDCAQAILDLVWTAICNGTLDVRTAEAWVRRVARNRLLDGVRGTRRGDPLELLETVAETSTMGESDPILRLKLAYAAALEARRPQDREGLERSWRRYWCTVDQGYTLDAVVRDEDPTANVETAHRAHARMVEAVLVHADADDRDRFRQLIGLRVLSGASTLKRHGGSDP